MGFRHTIGYAAALLWGAMVTTAAAAPSVQRNDSGATASVQATAACTASLYWPRSSPQGLQYRNECQPELAPNLQTLAGLVAALFPEGLPAQVKQLNAGRLVMTWPDFGVRMALAARDTPHWDAEKARRNNRFATSFVKEATGRKPIFGELDELFGKHGRSVSLVSVEKVLIGKPDMTPVEARLLQAGVRKDERLPFDAQVWFELKPR